MSLIPERFKNMHFNRRGFVAILAMGVVMTTWLAALICLFGPKLKNLKDLPVVRGRTVQSPTPTPDTTRPDSSVHYQNLRHAPQKTR
ncbi:hypothetical protein HDR63_02490 [bacterium]|nr:hypothetical protein [bacterium]